MCLCWRVTESCHLLVAYIGGDLVESGHRLEWGTGKQQCLLCPFNWESRAGAILTAAFLLGHIALDYLVT